MDQSSSPIDLTDADLVQRSAKGDETAFLDLYRRHQGAVFRFALHMSGKREIAEEVTQDVFVALLGGLRNYSAHRGSLEPYLIGMARNHVRRYLARSPIAAPPREEFFLPDLDEQQQVARVRAAILKLPPKYREVLVLCDLENLEYAEAAGHLGCAVGTVRSRRHRARALLEARLRARERCSI